MVRQVVFAAVLGLALTSARRHCRQARAERHAAGATPSAAGGHPVLAADGRRRAAGGARAPAPSPSDRCASGRRNAPSSAIVPVRREGATPRTRRSLPAARPCASLVVAFDSVWVPLCARSTRSPASIRKIAKCHATLTTRRRQRRRAHRRRRRQHLDAHRSKRRRVAHRSRTPTPRSPRSTCAGGATAVASGDDALWITSEDGNRADARESAQQRDRRDHRGRAASRGGWRSAKAACGRSTAATAASPASIQRPTRSSRRFPSMPPPPRRNRRRRRLGLDQRARPPDHPHRSAHAIARCSDSPAKAAARSSSRTDRCGSRQDPKSPGGSIRCSWPRCAPERPRRGRGSRRGRRSLRGGLTSFREARFARRHVQEQAWEERGRRPPDKRSEAAPGERERVRPPLGVSATRLALASRPLRLVDVRRLAEEHFGRLPSASRTASDAGGSSSFRSDAVAPISIASTPSAISSPAPEPAMPTPRMRSVVGIDDQLGHAVDAIDGDRAARCAATGTSRPRPCGPASPLRPR